MRSYLRPSTHRQTSANTRSAEFRRVGQPPLSHRLRLVKSRMALYHALSTCPLPCSEYLLNRLAAVHHLFHSLQSIPSSQHPQRLPSLGYPSIYLLLVKLVKTLLVDAFKLSSMAVPYLFSFGWGQGYKIMRLTRNGISRDAPPTPRQSLALSLTLYPLLRLGGLFR